MVAKCKKSPPVCFLALGRCRETQSVCMKAQVREESQTSVLSLWEGGDPLNQQVTSRASWGGITTATQGCGLGKIQQHGYFLRFSLSFCVTTKLSQPGACWGMARRPEAGLGAQGTWVREEGRPEPRWGGGQPQGPSGPDQAQRTRLYIPQTPRMPRNAGRCCVDLRTVASPPNLRDTSLPYFCSCTPINTSRKTQKMSRLLKHFFQRDLAFPTCAISTTRLSYAFNRCELTLICFSLK